MYHTDIHTNEVLHFFFNYNASACDFYLFYHMFVTYNITCLTTIIYSRQSHGSLLFIKIKKLFYYIESLIFCNS